MSRVEIILQVTNKDLCICRCFRYLYNGNGIFNFVTFDIPTLETTGPEGLNTGHKNPNYPHS